MKLLLAVAVYGLLALMLGWGILLAIKGKYALLIIAAAVYLLGLGILGCLPKKAH